MKALKNLEVLYKEGVITRREFLARVSAMGLAAMLTPSLLDSSAQAATPKKGGRFRIGLTGASTSDSLDPSTLDDQMDIHASYCIRNHLVEIDHEGKPIPELAESWEATPDASIWTFKLRQGVEFHNGKTMTAKDVVYSLNYHRGEDSKSGAKVLVKQIKDIKSSGKYEVVFTLEGGNADFPYILNDYHLLIAPEGTKGEQWDEGIGTGGYILQNWEPGIRAFFKRNPNYFKKNRAHFDEVEILGINDTTARTNALKTGEIDYMSRCDLKTVHLLEKDPNLQIIQVPSGFHYTIPMLTDVAPFTDNNVRLAMKHAIDREKLIHNFMRGYATIGNDHPILTQRYFADELPQRRYDPEKAAFLIKKAGIENHTFKLYSSTLGGFNDVAVLFKEQAAKAGINIGVIRQPEDGYWNNVWLKKPFCMCYWAGRPTADMQLTTAYLSDASWNDTHFKNERFDKLVKMARAELDSQKRREMYVECQRILRDQGGTIIPFFKDFVEAASDKLRFGKISSRMETDGHRASERWWFA